MDVMLCCLLDGAEADTVDATFCDLLKQETNQPLNLGAARSGWLTRSHHFRPWAES
jgi:hypothetical protein